MGKRPRTGVRVPIRGVLYPSVSEAARQLGVCFATVFGAMERGTLDNCGTRRDKLAGYLDGTYYPSKVAAARAMGVAPQVIYNRIIRGKSTWTPAKSSKC